MLEEWVCHARNGCYVAPYMSQWDVRSQGGLELWQPLHTTA